MSTIGETAKDYEPKQMKNIADLEAVSTSQEIKEETKLDKNNEEYETSFLVLPNAEGKTEKYRVPNSVLAKLKTILKEKPEMKTFKVVKEGENLNTSYTVVPLE